MPIIIIQDFFQTYISNSSQDATHFLLTIDDDESDADSKTKYLRDVMSSPLQANLSSAVFSLPQIF